MKKIDFRDMTGKTVAEVLVDANDETTIVAFTDRSYALFGLDPYAGSEESRNINDRRFDRYIRRYYELVDLERIGLVTSEMLAQEEAEALARKESEDAARTLRDRITYETLKRKFEGKHE